MPLDHPLIWPAVTLAVYHFGSVAYERLGRPAALNPAFVATCGLCAALVVLEVPYERYREDTQVFWLFLVLAIVALAVPLYRNLRKAWELLPVLVLSVVLGGAFIVASAAGLGAVAGLDPAMLHALSTKSVSMPIALGIGERSGTAAALTIVAVLTTGIPGAMIAPRILELLRVDDDRVKGLTLGMTAHAFGIARAAEIGERAVAFATLGMGLMGCFVALAVPLSLFLLGR